MVIELINLLARHSIAPTKCHWTELRIFSDISKGTIDLGSNQDKTIVGYTTCLFPTILDLNRFCNFIWWNNYILEVIIVDFVAISTNYSEIIILYEVFHVKSYGFTE